MLVILTEKLLKPMNNFHYKHLIDLFVQFLNMIFLNFKIDL